MTKTTIVVVDGYFLVLCMYDGKEMQTFKMCRKYIIYLNKLFFVFFYHILFLDVFTFPQLFSIVLWLYTFF